MPQLDVNTFLNQYAGVILTLLITYIILSYIVLPILLNINLVRTRLTHIKSNSNEKNSLMNRSELVSTGSLKVSNLLDGAKEQINRFSHSLVILTTTAGTRSNNSTNLDFNKFLSVDDSQAPLTSYFAYLAEFTYCDDE